MSISAKILREHYGDYKAQRIVDNKFTPSDCAVIALPGETPSRVVLVLVSNDDVDDLFVGVVPLSLLESKDDWRNSGKYIDLSDTLKSCCEAYYGNFESAEDFLKHENFCYLLKEEQSRSALLWMGECLFSETRTFGTWTFGDIFVNVFEGRARGGAPLYDTWVMSFREFCDIVKENKSEILEEYIEEEYFEDIDVENEESIADFLLDGLYDWNFFWDIVWEYSEPPVKLWASSFQELEMLLDETYF